MVPALFAKYLKVENFLLANYFTTVLKIVVDFRISKCIMELIDTTTKGQ